MRLKSFHTNAALILTALMLAVAAATTVATAQTYTDLYNFDGTHGAWPSYSSIVAQGRDGNLYGTTPWGGNSSNCYSGCGTVFKITPTGAETVLHNFDGVDGSYPSSGLTLGKDGNFYGTAFEGGPNDDGTIFKITKSGSLTTLYSFTNGADGGSPHAPPIQGTDGNFYGTTSGYAYRGTAYEITSSGIFTLLASLPGASSAPLLQATDGNFYGTTYNGGKHKRGTVFKIRPKGAMTIVYNFDLTHGAYPYGPVIQGSDGNFYGTTQYRGSNGEGVVFKLTPQGAITVLHNFPDPNYPHDGLEPYAGLVQATDGNFYGTTYYGGTGVCKYGCGVIFQITSTGAYTILYNFDRAHGEGPMSTPMQHTNGKIYGLTFGGGTSGDGVVYSFDMGLAPFVSLLSTSGKVGKTVEVLGQGFTNTTAVAFNGTTASFTVKSDTYLTAIVPSGATTGFVTVTTPSGTLTSNKQFTVKQ